MPAAVIATLAGSTAYCSLWYLLWVSPLTVLVFTSASATVAPDNWPGLLSPAEHPQWITTYHHLRRAGVVLQHEHRFLACTGMVVDSKK